MIRRPKGDGTIFKTETGWRGYITDRGRRIYFRAATKAEAQAKLRRLINGEDIREGGMTLAAWLDHFIGISDLAPKTRHEYEGAVDRYVRHTIGKIPLTELRADDVEDLYQRMIAGHVRLRGGSTACRKDCYTTVERVHAVLRRALTIAWKRGRIGSAIAEHIIVPRPRERIENATLTLPDAQQLLAAAMSDEGYGARWMLALVHGMRPAEALALTWPDIDFDAGIVHVRATMQALPGEPITRVSSVKSKAGYRSIQVAPFVLDALRSLRRVQLEWMAEAGRSWQVFEQAGTPVSLVFTQRTGAPISTSLDTARWRRFVASCGIPHIRRYSARHLAASLMVASGGDIAAIAQTLGHSNAAFTLRQYVHGMDEAKARLADAMQALAPEAVSDKVPNKVPTSKTGRGN